MSPLICRSWQLVDTGLKISNDRWGMNKQRCRVSLHWPLMKASDDEGHAGRKPTGTTQCASFHLLLFLLLFPIPSPYPFSFSLSLFLSFSLSLLSAAVEVGGNTAPAPAEAITVTVDRARVFIGSGRRIRFSRVAPATVDGRSRFTAYTQPDCLFCLCFFLSPQRDWIPPFCLKRCAVNCKCFLIVCYDGL